VIILIASELLCYSEASYSIKEKTETLRGLVVCSCGINIIGNLDLKLVSLQP
jgi:hypothetical protein